MTDSRHTNATTWDQRARLSIAHGCLTNSKRPESFVRGVYPTHLTRSKGCWVWDSKGKSYVDFVCGLGTNLLGYANREVNNEIAAQLSNGAVLSLGTTLEVEFAEKIQSAFPYCERIKILKTGTGGCEAAMRIARAATNKNWVLSEGYHGHGDDMVSLTPPAHGIPLPRPWITTLDKINTPGLLDITAAIIVEPVITDFSPERVQWLEWLRTICTKHKIALVFDETITAMRFPRLSVANHTGVYPDISVFGKALANGLPISVVGGRAKFMEAPYFISSTFGGDTLAMKAAMETIRLAQASIHEIWEQGGLFKEQFNAISPLIQIEGYNTRGVFKAKDDLTKALFFQECVKAGILFGSTWFWCQPHQDERDFVIQVCKTVINRIANGDVKLEGEMPVTPFAQKVREKEE